jgi:uncharacterized protein YjbI with pentapeptide repeats
VTYIEDQKFENLSYKNETLENIEYDDCVFEKCQFTEVKMIGCIFNQCEFRDCEFKLIKFDYCRMQNATFYNTLLMGINWDELQAGGAKSFPVETFNNCVLKFNNFIQAFLAKFDFSTCSIMDCFFLECSMNKVNSRNVIFKETNFTECNLSESDFRGATNYSIDILTNNIKKAKFSFPEVIALLDSLDISIEK